MKVLKIAVVAIAMSLALTSCSSTFLTRNLSFTDSGVKKPSAFPVLRATGYASISRQPGATPQMKQIKAMRASKIEAYRELSEQVNGVYISAKDSLNSNSVETSNNVNTEVDGTASDQIKLIRVQFMNSFSFRHDMTPHLFKTILRSFLPHTGPVSMNC